MTYRVVVPARQATYVGWRNRFLGTLIVYKFGLWTFCDNLKNCAKNFEGKSLQLLRTLDFCDNLKNCAKNFEGKSF